MKVIFDLPDGLTADDIPDLKTAITAWAKSRIKKESKRFIGISAAAARLGVHRGHLWAVLAGKRESRSLLKRYEALRRSKREDEA